MSDDLVKRLRDRDAYAKKHGWDNVVFGETADRIERLESALREIDMACDYSGSEYVCRGIARKALEATND